jgi:hypothetical protein
MDQKTSTPRSAGILLALGPVIGVVAGAMRGQPTIGFLIGTGVAIVLIALFWVVDRRR